MRKLVIFPLVWSLAACAGTPALNYAPLSKTISFPSLGQEATVSLGEDMVKQGVYTEVDGVEFLEENNIKGFRLSAGFYPQIADQSESTYHSFNITRALDGSGYLMRSVDLLGLPMAVPQSIRVSKDKQEICLIMGGIFRPQCDTEHSYKKTRKSSLSARDFQQTLIYNGRVGNRIKIGYRESSGDVARPAFSNEVEYDLSTSSDIAYRGAKLRILEADNQKIRYVVDSNFNSPN